LYSKAWNNAEHIANSFRHSDFPSNTAASPSLRLMSLRLLSKEKFNREVNSTKYLVDSNTHAINTQEIRYHIRRGTTTLKLDNVHVAFRKIKLYISKIKWMDRSLFYL